MKDQKGRGLSIIYNGNTCIEIERHKEISQVTCIANKIKFKIIPTYLTTNDEGRNQVIAWHVDSLLKKARGKTTAFLGDFSGHLGLIGEQEVNQNGNRVLHWAEKSNLTILSGDPKCEGVIITWSRGKQNSAIDFILVNRPMYSKFHNMKIEEDRE